ncbi:MAG: DNA polymerase III subunit delta [Cyanobacteriota bacterium]|nr:DNA polymerase III subunit delta [Cyanobacteriota bacterium]
MPIYVYWGEDDFALDRAVAALRDRTLDPAWGSFNFDKIPPDRANGEIEGLNQAMTPPFGGGGRLVWLVNTTLCQHCSADAIAELERTVKALPPESVLLLTSRKKPDGRLKSTRLLKKAAEAFQEFSPIPPWKTDLLEGRVREMARDMGIALTAEATARLAEAIGNDTRKLCGELQKLQLYRGESSQPIDAEAVDRLVTASTQNSLKLATAIRQGQVGVALGLVGDLLDRNEPVLRIVATLVGMFRTWLWVRLAIESGESDERNIARAAGVENPKRIYFLRQEVRGVSLDRLTQTLPVLLELEFALKRGGDDRLTLQTKVVELCEIFSQRTAMHDRRY